LGKQKQLPGIDFTAMCPLQCVIGHGEIDDGFVPPAGRSAAGTVDFPVSIQECSCFHEGGVDIIARKFNEQRTFFFQRGLAVF